MMLINCGLSAIAALLAIAALEKMQRGSNCAIRWAVLLMLMASIGQALGPVLRTWDHYVDTLLYGGMIAFLLANHRRMSTGVPARWALPASYAASIATVLIVLVDIGAH